MSGQIKKPTTTVNKLGALVSAGVNPQKLLVVGQKLSTGGAVAGTLIAGVSESDIGSKVGVKSMLGAQLRAIFKKFKDSGSLILPQVDIIALEDVSEGVKAYNTVTITEKGGSTNLATVAGVIEIIIGSEIQHKYRIPVSVGQTILSGAGSVGDAIKDAINNDPYSLLTCVNTSGVLVNTFAHKGTIGNGTTIKISGMSFDGTDYVLGNIKITSTAFGSGTTDPTVTSTLAAVGSNRYQTIVFPKEYGTAWVISHLDARWNVTNAIKDGVGICKCSDTYANQVSALNALNSKSLVYITDKKVADSLYYGSSVKEYDFVVSAMVGALRALRLTVGANISLITPASNSAGNDAEGGPHISTLPYFNTPIYDLGLIDEGKGFTDEESAALEVIGGTLIGNNITGTTVLLGDVTTTYKTDQSGNPDPSYHYLNSVDAISAGVEYQFNNLKKDYVQSRLTQGGLKKGYSMVNIDAFNARLKKYFCDLQEFAIAPDGKEAVDRYVANISTVADFVNGKITSGNQLTIVTQLRQILVNTQMSFNL